MATFGSLIVHFISLLIMALWTKKDNSQSGAYLYFFNSCIVQVCTTERFKYSLVHLAYFFSHHMHHSISLSFFIKYLSNFAGICSNMYIS